MESFKDNASVSMILHEDVLHKIADNQNVDPLSEIHDGKLCKAPTTKVALAGLYDLIGKL